MKQDDWNNTDAINASHTSATAGNGMYNIIYLFQLVKIIWYGNNHNQLIETTYIISWYKLISIPVVSSWGSGNVSFEDMGMMGYMMFEEEVSDMCVWRHGILDVVFDEAVFDEAVFDEAVFDEAVFDEAAFDEAVFDEAVFDEAAFDEAVFHVWCLMKLCFMCGVCGMSTSRSSWTCANWSLNSPNASMIKPADTTITDWLRQSTSH